MKARNKGSGIVEVIIGLAIIAIGVFSIIRAYNYYLRFAISHRYDVQSALLLEEGIEAIKILRDNSWSVKIAPLTSGTTYGLAYYGGTWTSTTSLKYIDNKFSRTFVLSDVYRDVNDKIAASGTLDPNTRKVTVSVAVKNIMATSTKTMSTYITNIFTN